MDYLKLLEHSYEETRDFLDKSMGRLEYIGNHIFDFTTYDGSMDSLFAQKAIEVCEAISNKETFEYQKTEDGYLWYLIMVNMPFFQGKLEWGTSIRGAWWDLHGKNEFELSSCGLFENGEQIQEPIKFNEEQWNQFITALSAFAEAGDET